MVAPVALTALLALVALLLRTLRAGGGPARLLSTVVRLMPPQRQPWGQAMLAELAHIPNGPKRWRFALGSVRVALIPAGTENGRRWGWRAVAAGAALAGATAVILHAVAPGVELFAAAFIFLVGCYAGTVLRRPHHAPAGAPHRELGAVMLLGVATVIALTIYASIRYPDAAADPTHLFSLVLAGALTVYLWLGITPPAALAGTGRRRWAGAVLAFGSGLLWAVPMMNLPSLQRYTGPAWVAAAGLTVTAACAAAYRHRLWAAGVRAGLWSGLIGALVMFTAGMAATLAAARHPITDPGVLADARAGHLHDPASYLVSDNLGGLIAMLLIIPVWAALLGALGGTLGAARKGEPAPDPPPTQPPST